MTKLQVVTRMPKAIIAHDMGMCCVKIISVQSESIYFAPGLYKCAMSDVMTIVHSLDTLQERPMCIAYVAQGLPRAPHKGLQLQSVYNLTMPWSNAIPYEHTIVAPGTSEGICTCHSGKTYAPPCSILVVHSAALLPNKADVEGQLINTWCTLSQNEAIARWQGCVLCKRQLHVMTSAFSEPPVYATTCPSM